MARQKKDHMSDACQKLTDNPYDTPAQDIKVLGKTVRENYFLLFLTFAFTVLAIAIIIYIVFKIVEAVRVYYRYYVRSDRAQYKDDDDERYTDGEADDDDEYAKDEYGRIQAKIQSIEDKYRAYNREIGSYARNVLGREPDDLMDEKILSRKHDYYEYSGKAEKTCGK